MNCKDCPYCSTCSPTNVGPPCSPTGRTTKSQPEIQNLKGTIAAALEMRTVSAGKSYTPAVEKDINGEDVNTNEWNELWESDPNCIHDIQPQPRGGVKCTKCRGWYCF